MEKTLTRDTLIEGKIVRKGQVIVIGEAEEIKVDNTKVEETSTVEESTKDNPQVDEKKLREYRRGANKLRKASETFKEKFAKKVKEGAMKNEDDRILALGAFLGYEDLDYTDIEKGYGDYEFETPDGDYLVVTDDEADIEFFDYQENLWDDLGLDSFTPSFQEWIIENAMYVTDTDKRLFLGDMEMMITGSPLSYEDYFDEEELIDFILDDEDFLRQVRDDYEEDIAEAGTTARDYAKDELLLDVEDALNMVEDANIDITDLAYGVAEAILDEYDGSILDYWSDTTGYSKGEVLDQLNIFRVDTRKVAEEVKAQDGRALSLAGYDHEENEEDINGTTYYIYRTN